MPREPIQEGPEEGGRLQIKEKIPVPPAADEHDAGLEASIRLKLDAGERLSDEEREYLARLPGDDEKRYQ